MKYIFVGGLFYQYYLPFQTFFFFGIFFFVFWEINCIRRVGHFFCWLVLSLARKKESRNFTLNRGVGYLAQHQPDMNDKGHRPAQRNLCWVGSFMRWLLLFSFFIGERFLFSKLSYICFENFWVANEIYIFKEEWRDSSKRCIFLVLVRYSMPWHC